MTSLSKNLTVSEILKSDATDEPKKKSREDWRKAKELEEARKAGTAPAAVDEEGKDINPHIPQYISATPWYYGSQGPTLKHQRIQPDHIPQYSRLDEWYKRGVNTESVATKYREGACENCGAMTHKKKDCFERPRKVGAKYNNRQIAPDEFLQPILNQSYDGKRDRWSGYDPSEHKAIIQQYQQIEEAKRHLRANKLDTGVDSKEVEDDDLQNDEEDEDKYVDEIDMPGTKVDSKQRITVRNLRIREDTAKYLRNLDPNSAYYDPKTRSMRDNPHKGKDPEEVDYAGENFVRFTGDTSKHATAQLFAWEAYEKGVDVHLLAEPTKLEILKREFESKKDEFKKHVQEQVLDKYGGEEHLRVPPKELLFSQTEDYRVYNRYGEVIKEGNEEHSCDEKRQPLPLTMNSKGRVKDLATDVEHKKPDCGRERHKKTALLHTAEEKTALLHTAEEKDSYSEKCDAIMDDRKRPYNSMYEIKKPTEDDMEEYNKKRKRDFDPMDSIM